LANCTTTERGDSQTASCPLSGGLAPPRSAIRAIPLNLPVLACDPFGIMDRSTDRTRDELLALRCQSGEPAAFGDLIAVFERPLRYYLLKLLGDDDRTYDVLQELWLKVVHTIRQLVEPAALRVWLYRLAHGLAVDHIRRRRVRQVAEQERALPDDAVESDPEFSQVDAQAVHRALDELNPIQREVLVLFFLEEMSLEDIADVVDCPTGTVKSRLHYAKRALHDLLKRGGYGPA
jgi:RNA polymerase sigma-70 factor (ECF subfamily)